MTRHQSYNESPLLTLTDAVRRIPFRGMGPFQGETVASQQLHFSIFTRVSELLDMNISSIVWHLHQHA